MDSSREGGNKSNPSGRALVLPERGAHQGKATLQFGNARAMKVSFRRALVFVVAFAWVVVVVRSALGEVWEPEELDVVHGRELRGLPGPQKVTREANVILALASLCLPYALVSSCCILIALAGCGELEVPTDTEEATFAFSFGITYSTIFIGGPFIPSVMFSYEVRDALRNGTSLDIDLDAYGETRVEIASPLVNAVFGIGIILLIAIVLMSCALGFVVFQLCTRYDQRNDVDFPERLKDPTYDSPLDIMIATGDREAPLCVFCSGVVFVVFVVILTLANTVLLPVFVPWAASTLYKFDIYGLRPIQLVECNATTSCQIAAGSLLQLDEEFELLGTSDAKYAVLDTNLTALGTVSGNTESPLDPCATFAVSNCVVDAIPESLRDSAPFIQMMLLAYLPSAVVLAALSLWLIPYIVYIVYQLLTADYSPYMENDGETQPSSEDGNRAALAVIIFFSIFDFGSDLVYISTQDFVSELLFGFAISFLVAPTLLFIFLTLDRQFISTKVYPGLVLGSALEWLWENHRYKPPRGHFSQLYHVVFYVAWLGLRPVLLLGCAAVGALLNIAWALAFLLFYLIMTFIYVSSKLMVFPTARNFYYRHFLGDKPHQNTPFSLNTSILTEVFFESIPQLVVTIINAATTSSLSDTIFIITVVGSALPIISNTYALLYRIAIAGFNAGMQISIVGDIPEDIETFKIGLKVVPNEE